MAGTIFLGFLNGYAPPWAEQLAAGVGRAFSWPATRINVDIDLDPYFAPERGQHHATLILARLLRHLPDPGSKIVGITAVDLYVPVLTFVFGQAQLGGHGAVVSTHRLHNELYGLPGDDALVFQRALKEVIHELGHAFGLVHCRDYNCVMNASTYVEDVDLKGAHLCSVCEARFAELRRAGAPPHESQSGG